jgi:hypothetical protein
MPASTPAMAPTSTMIASLPTGRTNSLMADPALAPAASTSAQPRNAPTPMPPTAPNVATRTDSQRTIDRTCDRVWPTARRRPSSRVRSWIESDSVLAMPIRAMTMASTSRA